MEEFPKNLYVQNTLYVDLKDIPKLPLPEALGEAPIYQPEIKVKKDFGTRKPGGKKKVWKKKT